MLRFQLVWIRSLVFILLVAPSAAIGQYVILEGRQFRDGSGNDFFPLVCNYLASFIYKDQDTATLCITPDATCDAWCYDCSTVAQCMDQMSDNFRRIRRMGFNAIRLMHVNPVYTNLKGEPKGWKIRAMDYSFSHKTGCGPESLNHNHDYYLAEPFTTNPVTQKLFTLLDSVLVRAFHADLKVILVTGGGKGDYPLDFPERYARYLDALALHVATKSPTLAREALLAYDIFNEPHYSWSGTSLWPMDTLGHSKQDQYRNIRLWYETLKANDPVHLVTMGGSSFSDVHEFDPGLLTLDFYSPHFFFRHKSYDPDNITAPLKRIHQHFVWLERNLKIPYIVGETGFRAKPDNSGPDGTMQDQLEYASTVLDMAKYYKASGFSWWNYQDYDWGNQDAYYGLLYRHPKTYKVTEKPAVEAFRNFQPDRVAPNFERPDNYYDPFNNRKHNPRRNHLTGRVTDNFGNPILDAYIEGWTLLYQSDGKSYYEHHYTFSDENGRYRIIPYDPDPRPPNYEVIIQVIISAPGYSRFKTEWYNDAKGVLALSVRNVVLKKILNDE